MAFYCSTMLSMARELALEDPAYEDLASKFFEHFVAITDPMNTLGGTGLWDEEDGFYYDQLHVDGRMIPLRVRSMVGLLPPVAAEVIEDETIERLPGFRKRLRWFLENRKDLGCRFESATGSHSHHLLTIPSKDRLVRVLRRLLDEGEFLSPHGIRSLSLAHRDRPYIFRVGGEEHRVAYVPGESDSGLFGGNSNWRGPVWMPVDYLLVEALERYHHFYGEALLVEWPTGSGRMATLGEVALDLQARGRPPGGGTEACHLKTRTRPERGRVAPGSSIRPLLRHSSVVNRVRDAPTCAMLALHSRPDTPGPSFYACNAVRRVRGLRRAKRALFNW
jgi:hypothetical protein